MTTMRWVVACLGLLALAACGPIVDYHPPELDPATSIIHEGHNCNG
jgi:hypothetical protein